MWEWSASFKEEEGLEKMRTEQWALSASVTKQLQQFQQSNVLEGRLRVIQSLRGDKDRTDYNHQWEKRDKMMAARWPARWYQNWGDLSTCGEAEAAGARS